MEFVSAGRTLATLDVNGNRTTNVFDVASQVIALIDAAGNRNSFTFDAAGRMTRLLDPLNRRTSYAFDAANRQTLRIDGRGYRTSYLYDAGDRLTGRKYPDGSRVTFGYNAVDKRTLMQDGNGRTTTVYEDRNLLRSVVNPANKKITYAFDAARQRQYLIEPGGGHFTYTFDDAGRIKRLLNPYSETTSWVYDAASRVLVQYNANSTRASYTYDDADQITRLANIRTAGTTISSFDYGYDPAGNRTVVKEATGARVSWSYDKTYQLTHEHRTVTWPYDITYTYDKTGKRLVKIDSGARTSYAYDNANQIRRYQDGTGINTLTFDANGNQSVQTVPAGGRTTYSWDYENRMSKVVLATGTRNTFLYDADGLRVQKQDSGGITKHVWDLQNILVETDGSDAIKAVYTLEPNYYGLLIAQRLSTGTTQFHFDGLGSTDRLTDAATNVTDGYVYQAFGPFESSNGLSNNSYRYVGRQGYYFDSAISQYQLRMRYYTSSLARFLSSDPLGVLLMRRTTPYTYVACNPTNLADPSGLTPLPLTLPLLPPIIVPNGLTIDFASANFGPATVVCCPPDISWLSTFAPRNGLLTGGAIVQHLKRELRIYSCVDDTVIEKDTRDFYQAFPIGSLNALDPTQFTISDNYFMRPSPLPADFGPSTLLNCGTYGYWHMRGYYQLVLNWQPRPLWFGPVGPSEWVGPGEEGFVPGAGFSMTTTNRPWWWVESGGVWREVFFSWDCCCCKPPSCVYQYAAGYGSGQLTF
jgi:RHS repeat-associated protein